MTNRYLLIIRNEENFAEKKTISFNFARGILLFTVILSLFMALSIYLVTFVLEQWLDPRYAIMQSNRQLIDLKMKIDSLDSKLQMQDNYVSNIRRIVGGDTEVFNTLETDRQQLDYNPTEIEFRESMPAIDSQFRAEFEKENLGVLTYRIERSEEFRELFLFTPMEGLVVDGFNPKADHYGVDIVAKENEPVKCTTDGVVIFSSWTLDSGYVIGIQHRGNLISVYKHNSELLKNVGNFVSGGEIIAIIGNTGELTSGPHLHFELWHNGNPVNPQEYIAF